MTGYPPPIPEISARETFEKLQKGDSFLLLDVREPYELSRAKLTDSRVEYAPMSALASQGIAALPDSARDPTAEIIVFCHQGVRSTQVTAWLMAQGWNNIKSLAGGIDAYAREVDPKIGFY